MKRVISLFIILITTIFLFGCTKKDSLYKRKGDKIYFGTYPQSLVSDKKLIDKLNKKAKTPSIDNNWISYKYYIENEVEDFMFYIDIDLNNDESYDYRGVYFDKYRPSDCIEVSSEAKSYQDNNGYSTNNVYWFKYEVIEWVILKEDNGKALLLSNLIIDSHELYPFFDLGKTDHNNGSGYDNNYELSTIRKWLNDGFYNSAFNIKEQALIDEIEVDNSIASTDKNAIEYICNNTIDKVFLLSLTEVMSLVDMETRTAGVTDYAKIEGVYTENTNYGYWRLRSPDSCGPTYAWTAMSDGIIRGGTVYTTSFGERPALWINL